MDKTLHLLQKSDLALDLNMASRGDFGENRLVGLAEKIPLVKPFFKKKKSGRKLDKLDAKNCLHRALEDPLLTSLLSSDTLVSGDAVFVPRHTRPARTPAGLCTAAVKDSRANASAALMTQDMDMSDSMDISDGISDSISDTTAELEPPKIPQTPGTDNTRCFTVKAGDSTDLPSVVKPQSALQNCPHSSIVDILSSVSKSVSVKDSAAASPNSTPILPQQQQPPLPPPPPPAHPDKRVLFQDKSEEASLDLVFELLTQLQYHTHQADAVDICVDFLRGLCALGDDCSRHHTVLPYHWQIRRSGSHAWQSVADESQEQLERLFCNPDNEHVRLKYQGRVFSLDFGAMRVCDLEFDRVRRLTTPTAAAAASPAPSSSPPPSCHTTWKYYCRDNFGWREYSEPVVKLIEEASARGLKEVRFITLQNQYILNIREGFQQNAVFGFRRQIKKRPMYMSSVVLTPHLQTLGGLSQSSSSPSADLTPSPSSPASPASLFPETWLPMPVSQDFLQVPVSRDDRSYRTVYSLFHKTVSETKFRIIKILRVQNPFLWEKYKRKKEYMLRRMSEVDRLLSERHLFHGTSADAVEGICKHNFDPRVCGKHATMFGQGSYFARKAVYSHNFSKRSPKGVHCMFLAKVLTGRFTVGNPSMRRPPPISPRDPCSDLYDSCVDNWVDPQIYVIFNDDQSYPYFIIHYEEVPTTVCV